jgi:2,4-dienoyl-CoA reductase (NADPH2)
MVEAGFTYRSLGQIEAECRRLRVDLGFSADTACLGEPLALDGKSVPNRFCIQPMEGFDADRRGRAGDLTLRRYRRFAAGGAGMIWFEAAAVCPPGRSNPRQLLVSPANLENLAGLVKLVRDIARRRWGEAHRPFCVLQLTHSGRFCRPEGRRAPLLAGHDSVFDHLVGVETDCQLATDAELEGIGEDIVLAAALAEKAGFDAVDIKACHRYLLSELLGCRERLGRYGGSYENRTRLLKETVRAIRTECPGLTVAVRLNASDMVRSETAWGVREVRPDRGSRRAPDAWPDSGPLHGTFIPDLTEPRRLAAELAALGVGLLNISAGTPYLNPHINRPYLRPVAGGRPQPEHPLAGVERLFDFGAEIQRVAGDLPVVGSGYTWLRRYGAQAAAFNVARGRHALAGFGRQAFAYPGFAGDILTAGSMTAAKCCTTCSRCSQLMIWDSPAGCTVHDRQVYLPLYKEEAARREAK